MDNLMNLIMAADSSKFKRPKKEFKLKRLSEMTGNEAFIELRGIGFDRLEEMRETAQDGTLRLLIAAEGICNIDLNDTALREHIGVDTKLPKTEVLKKLFTPGEIDDIYLEISKLSGYTKNTLEEIKKK